MLFIDKFAYIFVLCIALYILFKHFFSSIENSNPRDDLDRMIEEKKRSLGGGYSSIRNNSRSVPVKEKISDPFLQEIQKNLEWGGAQELDLEISEEISNLLNITTVAKSCSNSASELVHKSKTKIDFLESVLEIKFKESLQGKDSFILKGLRSHLIICSYLVSIGKVDQVFDKFDGTISSLKKIKAREDDLNFIIKSNLIEIISKLPSISKSIEKLILLNEGQIKSLVSLAKDDKSEYRKFLKTYHPDTMDLHIIPKLYKDKYMKIYSHQFSKIKDLIQS